VHADGRDPQEVLENVRKFQEQGYRYIRVQMGGYGGKGASMFRPKARRTGLTLTRAPTAATCSR
jgi:mannonate dehydratase